MKMQKHCSQRLSIALWLIFCLVAIWAMNGCGSVQAASQPTPTRQPRPTFTATAVPATATAISEPTATPSPTAQAQTLLTDALAHIDTQSHVQMHGTIWKGSKASNILLRFSAPDRVSLSDGYLEFIVTGERGDTIFVAQDDKWVKLANMTPEMKASFEQLWKSKSTYENVTYVGQETVNGATVSIFDCTVTEQSSERTIKGQMKYWIDTESNLPVRREGAYEEEGVTVTEHMFYTYDNSAEVVLPETYIEVDLSTGAHNPIGGDEHPQSVAPTQWQEFTDPDGRFVVMMPAIPTQEVLPITNSALEFTLHSNIAKTSDAAYEVSYIDFPAEVIAAWETNALLDFLRDSILSQMQGVIVEEISVELQGYPGRGIRSTIFNGQGLVRMRLYLVGNRLYAVLVSGSAETVLSAESNTFLNSLRLLADAVWA